MHLVQTTPSNLCRAMSLRILAKQGTDVEMKESQEGEVTDEAEDTDRSGSTPLVRSVILEAEKGMLTLFGTQESAYRALVEPAIDAATKSARTIINHLLTK